MYKSNTKDDMHTDVILGLRSLTALTFICRVTSFSGAFLPRTARNRSSTSKKKLSMRAWTNGRPWEDGSDRRRTVASHTCKFVIVNHDWNDGGRDNTMPKHQKGHHYCLRTHAYSHTKTPSRDLEQLHCILYRSF